MTTNGFRPATFRSMSPLRYFGLIVLFSLSLAGQPPSSDLLSGLSWRLARPFRGGRSVAASGVPGDGRTFFCELGRWQHRGRQLTPEPFGRRVFDSQPVASIGALEVAPSIHKSSTPVPANRTSGATWPVAMASTNPSTAARPGRTAALKDTRQISPDRSGCCKCECGLRCGVGSRLCA